MTGTASSTVAICLPAYNELENLEVLLPEIDETIAGRGLAKTWVIVFDDGSTDGTFSALANREFAAFELVVLRSVARLGKAAALNHAIKHALGNQADVIFMMDADGQDDPAGIPDMLEELSKGNDVVNGRRNDRQDKKSKTSSSRLFNGAVRAVTGIKMWDINSGYKAFNRLAAQSLAPYFYGELHRVVLVIAVWLGLEVGEVRVDNRQRISGASKYGVARGWRGLFDLVTVQFLRKYHGRPGHFFSGVGSFFVLTGVVLFLVGIVNLAAGGDDFFFDVLPWAGIMGIIFGAMFISFGFLSELTLFLSKNASTVVIRSSQDALRSD